MGSDNSQTRLNTNLAIAILICCTNDTPSEQQVDDLIARIAGDKSNSEWAKYDDLIFQMILAGSSSKHLFELDDNQFIDALCHVINNIHQYQSTKCKKDYFTTIVTANKDKQNVYFEPGRYTDIANNVYHASNGISSTMLKDARISLMYYHRRYITKEIQFERTEALDFGNLFHSLVLEPEKVAVEFSLPPAIPDHAFTNTDSMKKWLEQHNAKLPQPMSLDELKAIIEQHNAKLPEPFSLSGSLEEIGQGYMLLPEAFKTIPGDNKHTAIAMKACIKTYNVTLPMPLKITGNKENLLEQIQIIDADLANRERNKPNPLKTSGKKEELIQTIKSVKPDAVFADELMQAWINDNSRIRVTNEQYQLAKAMQQAVLNHPETSKLVNHHTKAVEVSYYGIDEETGLEIRVRPDLEIQLSDDHRIGFDLKSASLGRFKQDMMETMIKREIINRDYHVSAAMYCDIAMLDQFFWIFVNKDENYHWVAIVEASPELLELGRLEYKKTLRDINNAMNTNVWPAPVTDTLTIKLTDFESRKLEELQLEVA